MCRQLNHDSSNGRVPGWRSGVRIPLHLPLFLNLKMLLTYTLDNVDFNLVFVMEMCVGPGVTYSPRHSRFVDSNPAEVNGFF